MFYFVNLDDVIVGAGKTRHNRYKSVPVESIDVFGIEDPMGYRYKNGTLTKSEGLLSKDEYIKNLEYKKTRAEEISKIIVATTSGKHFDADEASQHRMLLALQTAQITGQKTTRWKMADNAIQEVTLEELKEALSMAANKMSEIFVGASNGDQ